MWQRGRQTVWKYDLKSAYPAAMCQIPDVRHGEWVSEYSDDAILGFHLCEIEPGSSPPILATWYNTSLLYPGLTKPVRCWLTNPEIRRLRQHGTVKPLDGVSFIPDDGAGYPWRGLLHELMGLKAEAKGDPAYYLAIKALINSFYGKTVQTTETDDGIKTGKIFNPVVGTTILALCRCWLHDAIHPNWDNVVAIATDSISMDKPIHDDLTIGDSLGDWEVEAENREGIFIRPGVYHVDGERPHTRGFRPPTQNGEYISFWNLFSNHDSDEYAIEYERPTTSREALHWNEIGRANRFEDRTYTLSLQDGRRLWDCQPETFAELCRNSYTSSPVPITVTEAVENVV
jgi:hypothetical protein